MNPGRPDATEYAPYAKSYVDLVAGSDIIKALTEQREDASRLLSSIDDARASALTCAPGKWTVKEVVHHIIDTERIFLYRALCIARSDGRPLPGFDQDFYVRNGFSPSVTIDDLRDEFRAARSATIWFFVNLPAEAWLRRGKANEYEVTVRGIAFTIAGHERHHVKILREKYLV